MGRQLPKKRRIVNESKANERQGNGTTKKRIDLLQQNACLRDAFSKEYLENISRSHSHHFAVTLSIFDHQFLYDIIEISFLFSSLIQPLVFSQISLLLCKSSSSNANQVYLHDKCREVFIKASSPLASLPFKGQVSQHTTVK